MKLQVVLFLFFSKFCASKSGMRLIYGCSLYTDVYGIYILEIVFTRAAPAFDNLFMGCVFNINTVHKTVEKLTFQAFY